MTLRAPVLFKAAATLGFLLCGLLCASSGASATGLPTMQRARLPFGSTLIVRRDASVASVAIELWFRAPSIGYGDQPVEGLAMYAANAVAASKPAGGASVSDTIKSVGGRFAISTYPDAVSIAASVPAGSESRVLKAMSSAYFSPAITAPGMRSARIDVVTAGAMRQVDPEATLHDVVFGALFASGPAHYSTVPANAAAISRVTLQQLQTFAARAFRSSNAVVAIAGNTQSDLTGAIGGGRVDGQPMEPPIDSTAQTAATTSSKTYGEDAVGLGWIGPPISDPKAATALDFIADYLFRPDTGLVAKSDLSSNVFLSGQFVTLHNPGVMLVEISGTGSDKVQSLALSDIEKLRAPLSASDFSAALTAFEYHILSDSQTPLSQADNFGWYTIEGDPSYAPSDDTQKYLQTAHSLDPGYVARIAQQYLSAPTVVRLKGTVKP